MKDANNNVTTYGYDGFDRLLTTTYPNTKVESVAYNPTGTLATRTTRNNEVFTFSGEFATEHGPKRTSTTS